jgi:hypothetical protein
MRIRRQRSLPGETRGGGGVSECPDDCPHDNVGLGGRCPADLPYAPLRERAGRRRRMARLGLGGHVTANADDRTAVLARSLGDRAPRRPVRRPGGPPGTRETRRAHGHPGRADLAALPRTDGADRRPCQRPVRGLRARPDAYRAAHVISAAAGAVLRAKGIRLRPFGERSPFMRRWRQRER